MAGKFFEALPTLQEIPKATRAKKPPKVKVVANPYSGPRGCDNCPLRPAWKRISTIQMEDSVYDKRSADILVLGAFPDEQDDRKGSPFTSDSYTLLRNLLPGRESPRLIFQNLVRCHDPANTGKLEDAAIHACSEHLEDTLSKYKIKAILGVGQIPFARFFPGASVWHAYGLKFVVEIGGKHYWYFPIIDPTNVGDPKRYTKPEWDPAYPVLKADINKFFKEVDSWPAPTVTPLSLDMVQFPKSKKEAREIVNRMSGPLGIDLETNKLKPYVKDAKILCAAISDTKTTIAFPIAHPEYTTPWGLTFLLEVVRERRWVAHNAAFELLWLLFFNKGSRLAGYEDSMACMRLYQQRELMLGLDFGTRLYLGTNVKDLSDLDVKRLEEYPIEAVMGYCGLDARACVLIYNQLRRHVNKTSYERIIGAIHATTYMELLGLPVDRNESFKLRDLWQARADEAAKKIASLYEVRAYERATGETFNPGSNPQLGKVLSEYAKIPLPKTASGKAVKTDEATLMAADPEHPLILNIKQYREATKQISTYVIPCLEAEQYPDGMLHPGYTTMRTATLRLSGEDPNIQNFPKRKHREVRRQIVAPKDQVFCAIDYGQLEVRIIAMNSRDRVLVQQLIDGFDLHSYWLDRLLVLEPNYLDRLADATNEKDEKKIRKAGRDTIKNHMVFASFFGGGAKSAAQRTGIALPKMQQALEEFWATYPGVAAWLKQMRATYAETGSLFTISGLVRHAIMTGNEPINNPVQAVGADIFIDSLNELSRLAVEEDNLFLHPRINIHDDHTFLFPKEPDLLAGYIERACEIMTKVRYDFQIVPMVAEVKIGPNWCDLEEVYVHTGDYVR